jgi:hypothetical protein
MPALLLASGAVALAHAPARGQTLFPFSSRFVWERPGANAAQFHRDARHCRRDDNFLRGGRGTITLGMDFFDDCLKSDGWSDERVTTTRRPGPSRVRTGANTAATN